jgi:hypothetical protein
MLSGGRRWESLEGSERQNAQRGLIGIWIEWELGEENARLDDDDLYSLRAIRVSKRSMRYWAGGGEKDRLLVWWCDTL